MKYAGRVQLFAMMIIMSAGLFCRAYPSGMGNAIYGIYSDTYEGVVYGTTAAEGVHMGADNGALLYPDTSTYTEAGRSLRVISPAGKQYAGFWIQFGWDGTYAPAKVATNMSTYSGGTIEFDIRATSDLSVKIEWSGGAKELFIADLNSSWLDGNWHHVSIPLSNFTGISLSNITIPASFYTKWNELAPQRTFWVDNVVWRKSTTGSLQIDLFNVSNNQSADSISWSGVDPGTGWKSADQYMRLQQTYYHSGWGIQIYTDNRATDASPYYTGSDDPAGLVAVSSPSIKIPMCWRVVDTSTTTLTIQRGAPEKPDRLWSQELGNAYPCFLWMMDRHSTNFVDGYDYATVWDDQRGIQHGEASFGGAVSPNYVYFGADFSGAMGSTTYRTGKLIVELFYE